MKRQILVASVAVLFATVPAAAMTDAECAAAWTKADANSDGVVSDAEGGRYFAALRVKNTAVADGKINRGAFESHCRAGFFDVARVDAGAPLPGSNSFTESQAQDRAVAAGYLKISPLAKDDAGIWRGTAMDGAKPVKVSVDFKGNVVVN
jgi:hypothetical protein